jgi:tRNA A-37 threonylcarbamoyl transferase component Bud32
LGVPIATGGMAVIRRGFDRWTQREIAHKRLRVDREQVRPRLNALFQREYDTLARLEHPNIVDVYDYGFDAQGPYYTMELLSGADLSKLSPLPYREACRILRDIASALALVHTRRLLHRDVSPNNVRLTSGGIAKLIDFGALTPFGQPAEIAGTPAFIAPECLEEVELDQRTDLYSLGALAYWTLTGRSAVPVSTIADLSEAWREPIDALSSRVAEVPPALEELVSSLMSHDRARRPSSAAEVIERLTTIADLAPELDERAVAYSYLKHPPLAGRSDTLAALRKELDGALEGRGGVVIVQAMAGLGRSELLDQITVDAQLRGATVLRAEGSAALTPHAVARRLIQLGTRIYPDLEGSEAFRRQLLELETSKLEGARHPMEAMERSAVAAARLRRLLLALSERGPIAILLDDAERADVESIGLLASMADELTRHPIILLLSVRDDVDATTRHELESLAQRARTIVLQNLEEAQAIELVQGIFGNVPHARRTALWLQHETGGNPGQCVDLLRLLMQRGAIRYTRGTFTLPHDIEADAARDRRSGALLTRLAGLSPQALRLVELLSLHQGSLTSLQLALASEQTPRDVLLLLERLVHRGVVLFTSDCASLRGESLRAVVEQRIDPAHKRLLHLALAGVADASDEDRLPRELARAWHLFRSGEEGERKAAKLIVQLLATHRHDVSQSPLAVPLLEGALEVYQKDGASDAQCAGLLSALCVTGFYGNLYAQRKYLWRALAALCQQTGMSVAAKLMPWLGARIALYVGLLWALVSGPFMSRLLGYRTIFRRFEDLLFAASVGMATAAAAIDVDTALEIDRRLLPVSGFPRRSSAGYGREFNLATAELVMGQTLSARDRYMSILAAKDDKLLFFDPRARAQLFAGALHARAHCEIEQPNRIALTLADELERASPFFAPHAETIRVLFHATRGDRDTAEHHRARAERLALRGGVSWTAASILAVRSLELNAVTAETSSIERSLSELERLSKLEPALAKHRELARARLALMRGQPQAAHDIIAAVIGSAHESADAYLVLRPAYAEALNRLGRFAEAKAQCLIVLDGMSEAQQKFSSALRLPFIQLARAEIGLGNLEQARALLQQRMSNAEQRNNPLELGALSRELALLAIHARDEPAFEQHTEAMLAFYQATQQPGLARQRDELWALATEAGLCDRPSMSLARANTSAFDEADGATVVEPRLQARVIPPPDES